MITVINAFSANMLGDIETPVAVSFHPVEWWEAMDMIADGFTSAVGHADTAAVFSEQLRTFVPCNRASVTLAQGDCALLGQYSGPRLPEGCKTLPEGGKHQVVFGAGQLRLAVRHDLQPWWRGNYREGLS